jgi:hypothetical protein
MKSSKYIMEDIMSNAKKITLAAAVLIIIALMVTAAITGGHNNTVDCPDCSNPLEALLCETCGGEETIRGSLWALLPPVIAIGLALITKEVYSSLFIGILSGALLAADFSFTGMMDMITSDALTAAVADTAGTIIALNNRVDGDLQTQIDACITERQNLSRAHMQARVAGETDAQTMAYVENIVRACGAWETVDLGKINSKSTGAAISSGAGAAMAIAGMVTSISANSDGVRNNNTEDGKKKEKNKNTNN